MRNGMLLLLEGVAEKVKGNIYRKQVMRYGRFISPNDPNPKKPTIFVKFDKAYGDVLIRNFNNKVLDSMPVQYKHPEEPEKIVGAVTALEHSADGSGLDAITEITDPIAASQIDMKLSNGEPVMKGVSLGLESGYVDRETGKDMGPVARHLAIVTHGYIKGMKPFEKMLFGEDDTTEYVNLEEAPDMEATLADVLAFMKKNGMEFDDLESMKKAMSKMEDKPISLADLDESVKKIVGSMNLNDNGGATVINALGKQLTELGDKVRGMEATEAVGKLVRAGKVIPAQVEDMKTLYLTDAGLFDRVTSKLPVLVKLGDEKFPEPGGIIPGADGPADGKKNLTDDDVKSEIEKYSDVAKTLVFPKNK